MLPGGGLLDTWAELQLLTGFAGALCPSTSPSLCSVLNLDSGMSSSDESSQTLLICGTLVDTGAELQLLAEFSGALCPSTSPLWRSALNLDSGISSSDKSSLLNWTAEWCTATSVEFFSESCCEMVVLSNLQVLILSS